MSALARDLAARFGVADVDAYEATHDRMLAPAGDTPSARRMDVNRSIGALFAMEAEANRLASLLSAGSAAA